jgi:hypothetical protein
MIYSLIISSVCIFTALRLIFAAFIKDGYFLKLIGDPFHLIGDQMSFNISFAIFVLIGIKVRLIYI